MTNFSFSQNTEKIISAIRVSEPPKIDGNLDDAAWKDVPIATDFIQNEPNPGLPSSMKTEVKVVYDNSAIYIGAMMYDSSPDSILKELSPRDGGFNNADQFSILFDTYNDDLNGFALMVSVAGVQNDVKFSDGGDEEDGNWNAVWESKTKIVNNGWIAEMKVPYSAIRFPNKKEQEWGVHFMRLIRRYRETSFWTEVKPTEQNFIKQAGKLLGINNIESPLRLSFYPYISSGIEHYPYNVEGKSNYSRSVKGGMDLKYGINDAFTLDMTLIPDFGQVQSDNKVLNLTPFEIRYEDHRPFFTEGTELFNKGGLFYSRRIGAEPSGFEEVENKLNKNETVNNNPEETQLINATKISGRNKNDLGIGFFNAMTADAFATAEDTVTGDKRKILTEPFTNYNVVVFDQTLKNNSSIGVINTNVNRFGGKRNADVSAMYFKLVNRKNSYAISGMSALSQVFTRADTVKNYNNELGYKYLLNISKIKGNFQFNIWQNLESDTYNPNDLGYLQTNNEFSNEVAFGYSIYEPFWKILKTENYFGMEHNALYKGLKYSSFKIYFNSDTDWKNYLANGVDVEFFPFDTYDYYEPRMEGKYFIRPSYGNYVYWFSSDYRKRFAIDGHIAYGATPQFGTSGYSFSLGPRMRVNDRLSFQTGATSENVKNDFGWVDIVPPDIYLFENFEKIIFGKRNVSTVKVDFNTMFIFSNKMFLSLTAYHNWTRVEYFQYFTLEDDGRLKDNALYSGNQNANFDNFNLKLEYNWEFAPGSTMSIVWKNVIDEPPASVLSRNYFDEFSKTIDLPQTNSISVKVLYYLDYLKLKRKKR